MFTTKINSPEIICIQRDQIIRWIKIATIVFLGIIVVSSILFIALGSSRDMNQGSSFPLVQNHFLPISTPPPADSLPMRNTTPIIIQDAIYAQSAGPLPIQTAPSR